MFLQICLECAHGGEKNGRSHCGKEAIYSSLTNCIQRIALADYLERHSVEDLDPGFKIQEAR